MTSDGRKTETGLISWGGYLDDDPEKEMSSLLSKKQRGFLRNNSGSGSDPNRTRATQSRIRTRFRWGMYDLSLLFRCLDREERAKIFNDVGGQREKASIAQGIADALGFFYLAVVDFNDGEAAAKREEYGDYEGPAVQMGEYLYRGIARGCTQDDIYVKGINIDISVDRFPEIDELADTDIEDFPEEVLKELLRRGDISPTLYGEVIQKRL